MVEYNTIGENKCKLSLLKMIVLGIVAGFFISVAAFLSVKCSYTISNVSVNKILSAFFFSFGLILVVLMKSELFTGNILLFIPLFNKKVEFKKVLKNLIVVYFSNFIGAIIFSLLIFHSYKFDNNLLNAFSNIAFSKINIDFYKLIILSILCNIMVCTAVFLASTSKNTIEKILVIIIPVFIFVSLGFEHSVANMFYLTIGKLIENSISFKDIFISNLLPVTIGNIIGGLIVSLYIYIRDK